jgi:hypothetical protein
MITDMKNRGFNGVVIDWYGQGHSTDGVTQKIKSYLASLTNNTFTYIIMVKLLLVRLARYDFIFWVTPSVL